MSGYEYRNIGREVIGLLMGPILIASRTSCHRLQEPGEKPRFAAARTAAKQPSQKCRPTRRRQFDRVGRLLHNPGLCFFAAALSTISHRLEEFRHRAAAHPKPAAIWMPRHIGIRSEEHTYELQPLMRNS